MDLNNFFSSLKVPSELADTLRFLVDNSFFSFDGLPFGSTHSSAICHQVILHSVREAQVIGVLYLEDVLVLGYGKSWVSEQAAKIADCMCASWAIVNRKSMLDAVEGIAWVGKFFDLRKRTISKAKGHSQVLFANWWQFHVPSANCCVSRNGSCGTCGVLYFLPRLFGHSFFGSPNRWLIRRCNGCTHCLLS